MLSKKSSVEDFGRGKPNSFFVFIVVYNHFDTSTLDNVSV